MILFAVFAANSIFVSAQNKSQTLREFRGAWIQCVNGQFQGLSTQEMQSNLTHQLNVLKDEGVNAVIFQVRPECDALYQSSLEPWSKFLTGVQGRAPQPYWDPLQWMVEECHKRGMELHAWINPYRAKTKGTTELAGNHVVRQHPEYCFEYDGLRILNPAFKETRELTCKVAADIVRRYDIDGFHIDDYFYPYPVAGQPIPDDAQYNYYVNRGGKLSLGDWRRENVNAFIQQLNKTIKSVKPWVKFGVSPFGIYRNKRTDANGSDTRGTQNYDDLYADCVKWAQNGWCDYMVPQLYWQIGHSAADYETLIYWWNNNIKNCNLYIGEDIERTVKYKDVNNPERDQMNAKYNLHLKNKNVKGTVLWYSRVAVDNVGNYGSRLKGTYWKTPAKQPLYPSLSKNAPDAVYKPKCKKIDGKQVIIWLEYEESEWDKVPTKYAVYRFDYKETPDFSDESHIVGYTTKPYYVIPNCEDCKNGVHRKHKKQKYAYYVTALNRLDSEGEPSNRIKVKH